MKTDRIVFESAMVKVGAFRLPIGDPSFEDTGPVENYLFVFPRHACWIEHQGQRPFVADSTTVPLYNRGQPYRRGAIDPKGDATDWFGVDPALLRDMVAQFDPEGAAASERLFARDRVSSSPALFMLQRRIFTYVTETAAPDAMYVEESVITMLADLLHRSFASSPPRPRPRSNDALAMRARAHLARTFLLKEGVDDVAAVLGVSPFHLCRIFRRETGFTLHRYRTELRLRWSLEPLADGIDILSTALAAGFSHHSHFTRAFHRTFGVPPSGFRKDQRRVGAIPLEMMNTRPE